MVEREGKGNENEGSKKCTCRCHEISTIVLRIRVLAEPDHVEISLRVSPDWSMDRVRQSLVEACECGQAVFCSVSKGPNGEQKVEPLQLPEKARLKLDMTKSDRLQLFFNSKKVRDKQILREVVENFIRKGRPPIECEKKFKDNLAEIPVICAQCEVIIYSNFR